MKSKRLFIIMTVFLIAVSGVSTAAGMRVQAAGNEETLELRAQASAAKAENADQRVYTDSELCSMAKYYYMRTSSSRVYPAVVEIEHKEDDTCLISLWEKKPGPEQDPSARYDARYSVNVYGKGVYVSKGEEIDLTVYSKVYSAEELCRLAQNYYFKMNDFYPPNADAKDNGDGTFTICLYESICDDEGNPHTSTCGWYTVDVCGMGTDDMNGARVDINP